MSFENPPRKNLIISTVIALGILLTGFSLVRGNGMYYSNERAAANTALPEVLSGTSGGENPKNKLDSSRDSETATSPEMLAAKKEFFAKYLAEGSKNIKETTFNDLIKKVDTKPFAPKNGLTDLTISSDNSVSGVKTYVNAFGSVIKNYLTNPIDRSEDAVISDAITKKDSGTKGDLEILSIMYKNFSNDLASLRVPSKLSKAHLLIVNGYRGMGNGLLSLSTIGEKPMDGAAGYEAYMKYRLDVINGYALIVAALHDQHISFTSNEPGYPFYWNIASNKEWIQQ